MKGRPDTLTLRLSLREVEVLRLVALGLSNEQIGRALWISPHTATSHVAHLLTKLGVASRAAAVGAGYEQGILRVGEHTTVETARVSRVECEACDRAAPAGSPGWHARLVDDGTLAVLCVRCAGPVDAIVRGVGS